MSQSSAFQRWLGRALLAGGVVTFAVMLRNADLSGAMRVLASTGPFLALAALPYLAQIGFDALAWRTLLGSLGRRVRWRRLLAVRLSTEAVLLSTPAGTFFGEMLKPFLLAKTDGVPASDTIASIGVKKALLTFADAAYLGTALVVGWSVLARASHALIGMGGAPWIVAGAVALLIVVGVVMSIAFLGLGLGDFAHRMLMRIPVARFRVWIETRRAPFQDTDSAFRRLHDGPRRNIAAAFVALVAAWFVEAAETYLVLHLLGIQLPLASVLVMEASVVFLRNVAFFVPAGLGVQDAGYFAFLHAYAVPEASAAAAAFVIVKRTKELLWVAIGYVTLFVLQHRVRPPAAQVLVAATTETS